MSNTKILAELTDNDLFNFSIKNFKENELEDIYKLKSDDTTLSVKKRVNFYLFNYLIKEQLSQKMKNYVLEDYSQEFLDFLVNKSKLTNNPGEELIEISKQFISDKIAKSKLMSSYIELKGEFNTLVNQIEKKSLDTGLLADKLNELDKKIVGIFSNIQLYLSFALNIDWLRDNISFNILKIKLEKAEKSKEKKANLNNLYAEIKANKLKKSNSLQNIISKINEQIQNQHSKILVNTNKLKMTDLSRSMQMFIKYNEEINSSYDKYLSQANIKNRDDLDTQTENRINLLDEHVKAIKLKSPQSLKDDLKYLIYLYEINSYHKIRLSEINNYLEKNIGDLLSLVEYLRNEQKRFNAMNIFSHDELNYINIKDYIEGNNKAVLNIHIKPTYSACRFTHDDVTLLGMVRMIINKSENYYNLEIAEKDMKEHISNIHSYNFNDIDSMLKFIISGFKKLDTLNTLK